MLGPQSKAIRVQDQIKKIGKCPYLKGGARVLSCEAEKGRCLKEDDQFIIAPFCWHVSQIDYSQTRLKIRRAQE